jgi:hypothetical protein
MPQECEFPEQDASGALSPPLDANTENFLFSFVEPQCGHLVPSQSLERTSTSLSFSQLPQ